MHPLQEALLLKVNLPRIPSTGTTLVGSTRYLVRHLGGLLLRRWAILTSRQRHVLEGCHATNEKSGTRDDVISNRVIISISPPFFSTIFLEFWFYQIRSFAGCVRDNGDFLVPVV